MRDESLNEHLFFSIRHARAVITGWVQDYKTARPHASLGYLTPAAYAEALRPQRPSAPEHAILTPRLQSPPDERWGSVTRRTVPTAVDPVSTFYHCPPGGSVENLATP